MHTLSPDSEQVITWLGSKRYSAIGSSVLPRVHQFSLHYENDNTLAQVSDGRRKFHTMPTSRVNSTAERGLDVSSHGQKEVWTNSVLGESIHEKRTGCPS